MPAPFDSFPTGTYVPMRKRGTDEEGWTVQQPVALPNTRSINPHHFGPLDDQSRPDHVPGTLFSGVERFLGKGEIKRRTVLWNALAERLERVCAADEQVLYVAPAIQKVGFLHYMALGVIVQKYHQVVLVITSRRVLEVLLAFNGKTVAHRTRSYAWGQTAQVKLSLGRLVLKSDEGKSETWKLAKRGDRKLLKLLLPKIQERLTQRPATGGHAWPALHCSECGGPLATKPTNCAACSTPLRSPGLAAALSLAFPGAGLLYAGHPVLATFDFIGESFVYVLFASMLLVSTSAVDLTGALFFGAFLLFLTKVESLHIGHLLIARRPIETVERRARWKKIAYAGGSISVLALVVALIGVGALGNPIDRDLDFASASIWSGSRNPDDWNSFVDDPDIRSQWFHSDGWTATIFAYPLEPGQTAQAFHDEFVQYETATGAQLLLDDTQLPHGLTGFRVVEQIDPGDGPMVVVHFFVSDAQSDDVHQVLMAVEPSEVAEAEAAMQSLLAQANWIEAAPPTP